MVKQIRSWAVLAALVSVSGCAARLNATRIDSEVPSGAKVTMLVARDDGLSFHGRFGEFMFRVSNTSPTPLTIQTRYIYLATRLGMRWCKPAAVSPYLPPPTDPRVVAPGQSEDVVVRCRIDGIQGHDEIKVGLGKAFSTNNTILPLPLLSLLVD